jgi:exonuclease I
MLSAAAPVLMAQVIHITHNGAVLVVVLLESIVSLLQQSSPTWQDNLYLDKELMVAMVVIIPLHSLAVAAAVALRVQATTFTLVTALLVTTQAVVKAFNLQLQEH